METIYINSTDGYELCLNVYEASEPKACVQILHGMEEHQGRYKDFAEALVAAGYNVVSSDMRGHGANAPIPGFFKEQDGYKYLLDDQKAVTAYIKSRFNVEKVILFAHSMGTIIARNLLQTESADYAKVVLSGYPFYPTPLPIADVVGRMIKAVRGPKYVSPFLQQLVLGGFNKQIKSAKTDYDWLSANEQNVQSYIDDPLCGHIFTVSAFLDLFALLRSMHNPDNYHIADPQLPILAIRGEQDPSTGFDKGSKDSILTLNRAGFVNIRRIVYKGMRHELLNETDKNKVYKDVLAFLK